ncbi:CPBP family intramembrane glutamic endopeptidase [Enterococcus sp. DIV0876]|uniref:CPBP family intramembrane glutamic endopeptidase n=1 Tax=Enterococcus sp. DIV0876 TaxID=2774633 RepID=UPI003D2FDF53
MSLSKYSFATILTYGIVFFLPGAFVSAGLAVPATTIGYLVGAVMMVGLYFFQKEPLSFEHHRSKPSAIFIYGLSGIIIAILLQNVAVFIESLFGEVTASENTANIIQIILHQPLFALAAMVGGPIMEEFVFRRALVGIIGKYTHVGIGIGISAIAFAFAHNDGHLLVYIFLGLFFSGLYALTGSIWTSMITHVGMNTLVVIVQLLVYHGYIQVP